MLGLGATTWSILEHVKWNGVFWQGQAFSGNPLRGKPQGYLTKYILSNSNARSLSFGTQGKPTPPSGRAVFVGLVNGEKL